MLPGPVRFRSHRNMNRTRRCVTGYYGCLLSYEHLVTVITRPHSLPVLPVGYI